MYLLFGDVHVIYKLRSKLQGILKSITVQDLHSPRRHFLVVHTRVLTNEARRSGVVRCSRHKITKLNGSLSN